MAAYQKFTATYVVRNEDLAFLMNIVSEGASAFSEHSPLFAAQFAAQGTPEPENAGKIMATYEAEQLGKDVRS